MVAYRVVAMDTLAQILPVIFAV